MAPGATVAFGVGTAGDGNVYISGDSFGTGMKETVIPVKFDANGNVISETLLGPSFGSGSAVAVAPDGNVRVTGNVDEVRVIRARSWLVFRS